MKYLITQSLLSSWMYALVLDGGYANFLKTLHREPIQPNKAMLDGIRFENVLNSVLNGFEIEPSHEWYKPISALSPILSCAQQQADFSKNTHISDMHFVLYGRLDYLKAGVIYDTKYSKTYRVGKYLESPQHAMYFALVPEAREFQYKICDGTWIYTETYCPADTIPIEKIIANFVQFLKNMSLMKSYQEFWKSKY